MKRVVSAFVPHIVHLFVFLLGWCFLGWLAVKSEMIQHPGWWMVYAYVVYEACWTVANKTKKNIEKRIGR